MVEWNLDDLPIFVAVVDQNGFSAAADYLGISKSAVSKALQRLEQGLGARLLERNSRNFRITSEGEAFYRQGVAILEQVHEADNLMSGLTREPRGKLVVAMPSGFAREIVAPRLVEFDRDYPDIDLDIVITSHAVDIIRDQIDMAVVIGSQDDSELVMRTLYESRLTCVTSPAYLQEHDLGHTLEALQSHIKICETRYANSRLPLSIDGHKKYLDLRHQAIHVNDPTTVREAVVHGCGVGLVPDQYCKKHLANGELVRVYDNVSFEQSVSVVSAIYPSRRLLASKTRAFLDFLVATCRLI